MNLVDYGPKPSGPTHPPKPPPPPPPPSSIAVFEFPATGTPVRTVVLDGEPWFVASDVTAILGYSNGRMAVGGLPDRMKSSVTIADGTPGNPNRALISESGVYRLAMRSNLPSAERFQDWLAEEVVPTIRRTGKFAVTPVAPALPDITTPNGVLALAEMFAQTARQLVDADERIREMEPKALAHDAFLSVVSGDLLVREAAKALGWQETALRRFLVDEHLLYERQATCGTRQWDFYAANRDHFRAVLTDVQHGFGKCAHYTVYITPRGMDLIHKRITKHRDAMRLAIGGES